MGRYSFLVWDRPLINIRAVKLTFRRDGRNWSTVQHDVLNQKLEFNTAYPWGTYVIHYQHLGTNNRWSDWYYTDPFFISMPLTITSPTVGQSLWGPIGVISGNATPFGHVQIVRASDHQPLSGVGTLQSGSNWALGLYESLAPGTYSAKVIHWITGYKPLYSDSFTFILRPPPVITLPGSNGVIASKPVVSGTGEPGATVFIHKSGDGTTVYGAATVQPGGNWSTTLTRDLPQGVYKLSAKQNKDNSESSWSETTLAVKVLGVPSISSPAAGEQEQTFTMTGGGGLGNQNVQVEVFTDTTNTYWGVGSVQSNGSWSVALSNLRSGPLSLTAQQQLGSGASVRAAPKSYKIRPPKLPSITVTSPNETTVRLSGTAYNAVGADTKVHIHYRNNSSSPLPDVTVSNGNWVKDITGLLPSNSQYAFDVQQSVTDGVGGRIKNTGWTEALVTVICPKPVLAAPTLNGQIPTFSGSRNVWQSTRGGAIQIQLNGQTHTLLPDLQGSAVSWTLTAAGKIAPGRYPVRARQGINSVWSEFAVLAAQLVIRPDLPELFKPPAGVETPQAVQFHGKTWPNAKVVVRFKNGELIREVTSNATTGEWSFNYTLPLGLVEVQVLSTFGGQTSNVTNQSFPVKTPPPRVTSPTPGNNEVPPKPVIEGRGIAGCWVHVYSLNTDLQLGRGQVGTDNTWTVTLDEQNLGDLRIYTKQFFNTTYASNETDALLIKVVVPSPSIEVPGSGTKPARTFTVSGKGGWPGGVIDLTLNGQPSTYKDIPVQADGSWQVAVTSVVGALDIKAVQRYKGVLSKDSLGRSVNVVPAVPVIDTPRNSEAVGAMLRISGFGYPGDSIRIDRRGNFADLGSTEVTEAGTWSASVRHNMVAGNGITAIAGADREFYSDYTPMIELSLLKPAPRITVPLEGDWVSVRPQFSGVATPKATITVASWFNTDIVLAKPAVADDDGNWAVTGNQNLPEGAAWVVVRETLGGTVSEWAESGRFMVE